jgi:hypothetical protein
MIKRSWVQTPITLKEKLKIKVAKWGTPKNILKTKQKNCIFEGSVIFSENDSDAFQIQCVRTKRRMKCLRKSILLRFTILRKNPHHIRITVLSVFLSFFLSFLMFVFIFYKTLLL